MRGDYHIQWSSVVGEGTIAVGKRYIIAAIIVGVLIIVLVISAIIAYTKFGDDIKKKIGTRNKKRNRRTSDSDSEAVPLPPYSRTDPSM